MKFERVEFFFQSKYHCFNHKDKLELIKLTAFMIGSWNFSVYVIFLISFKV